MIWAPAAVLPIAPIFKVPILYANARATQVAYTAPQPVPDKDETTKYPGYTHDVTSFNFARNLAASARGLHWIVAFCESTVVLATTFPSSLSSEALSFLVRDGYSASAVQFTQAWVLGSALIGLGGYLRFACYRELGRFFTWELSVKKDHNLVTSGPYSIVRHPAYTAMLIASLGTFLRVAGPGSWLREAGWLDTFAGKIIVGLWFAYSVYLPSKLMARVNREDKVLRNQFPEEWDAYAKKTPYRLIPFVY